MKLQEQSWRIQGILSGVSELISWFYKAATATVPFMYQPAIVDPQDLEYTCRNCVLFQEGWLFRYIQGTPLKYNYYT